MNNEAGWIYMVKVLSGAQYQPANIQMLAETFAKSVGTVSDKPRVYYILERK